MQRCEAETTQGRRCLNHARDGSVYCAKHSDQLDLGKVIAITAGMLAGNVLIPGIGGLLAGGIAGNFITKLLREENMAKQRVFVSFDFDHDEGTKIMLAGQAKLADSPFDFTDASVKDHLTGDWKEKVRRRMDNIDVVIVLCGESTHTAKGVSAELEIAQEKQKAYFCLRAYKDKTCTKPTSAKATDKIYDWTWDNLKLLIGGAR